MRTSKCTVGLTYKLPLAHSMNKGCFCSLVYLNNICLFHKLVNSYASSNVSAYYKCPLGFIAVSKLVSPAVSQASLTYSFLLHFYPRDSHTVYTLICIINVSHIQHVKCFKGVYLALSCLSLYRSYYPGQCVFLPFRIIFCPFS